MPVRLPIKRVQLINQIVRSAMPRPRGAGSLRELPWCLRAYFGGVDEDDLARRRGRECALLALHHAQVAGQLRRGRPTVKLFCPTMMEHGFDSPHSFVAIVTRDMPFLVDSVGMVFSGAGVGVHLLIHPVLRVQRDRRGHPLQAAAAGETTGSQPPESWQLYEIDRQVDPERIRMLLRGIQLALRDVRSVVHDWRPMRRQLEALARALRDAPPARVSAANAAESAALLEWMAVQHFIVMGYRRYVLARGRRSDRLLPDLPTGLGLLRSAGQNPPHPPRQLTGAQRRAARSAEPMVITKANTVSTVHRATQLDYVAVKEFDQRGQVCGEHRFLGLWTSTAYFASPREIPILRSKVSQIIDGFGLDASSHDGKAVLAVMETYPRDELFQATVPELMTLVRGVVNLYERRTTRLLARRDPFGRFWSFMVYVPRDRYTTDVRHRIEQILLAAAAGVGLESQVQISESSHARVHVLVRTAENLTRSRTPDFAALQNRISAAATTWSDRLRAALDSAHEPGAAIRLFERYAQAFPLSYQDDIDPPDALDDVADLEQLGPDPAALRLNLHRPPGEPLSRLHLKFLKRGDPIPVSDLLPMLENFGLRVLSEHPYEIALADGKASIQDFGFEHRGGAPVDIERVEQRFTQAFLAVWRGELDNDGFNRLLLLAGLDARELLVLRCCCRYLLQTGLPFSQAYMERVLAAHAALAADLVRLFHAQFDPDAVAAAREPRATRIAAGITARLESVTSADEDRILRAFVALCRAMLRTNFYQAGPRPALAFKLDPEKIPNLPLPRPVYEIFVHSTRVEGVHLRKGLVARGGIRWSDRREDFRTEVLGLMKAQNVKNTLIVPVGAKGGFVPRRLQPGASRDDAQREGVAAYREFIGALLDVTDNLVRGVPTAPARTVRRDGDDAYLVVAADKGTATFSDIANAIAVERDFWLGDAFASGGSAGYDHKKMGITARGAWECVKRHFRELGTDIQSQPFTVAGIGDMSGDVFGNGLLLSPQIRLVAAFNHQHIFLDPEPDAARSLAERRRLFALPRSTWADYDRRLLSRGGGVFERSAKSIALSPEVQRRLGLQQSALAPADLIRAILRMPVDLLWNGGIGTYVKAAGESHAAAGDRGNDAVRVDGRELRARVVGEGGNLGFTQLGRVEYALAGGRLNTDFIDNSAGVNSSDVEVNLKILMAPEERVGRLQRRDRNRLLARLTDEVAALVLRNNYLQSQALSSLEAESLRRLPELQHAIRALEAAGELNRAVEFMPSDDALAERRKQGQGLTRPELSVLLAYSKIVLNEQLLASDVPEDAFFAAELARYFPAEVRQRLGAAIPRHRLRREIISTAITNSLVNRMGPTFVLRATEDTGAAPAQVARAYSIARESFGLRRHWAAIEALDTRVAAAAQYGLYRATARLLRHGTYWLLRHRPDDLAVDRTVREFAPALAQLADGIDGALQGVDRDRFAAHFALHRAAGVPEGLARFVASNHALDCALDLAELAAQRRLPAPNCARIWFDVGTKLGLDWLQAQIEGLTVDGTWQATARSGLRDSTHDIQRRLVAQVLGQRGRGGPTQRVDAWLQSIATARTQWLRTLAEMRAAGTADFATVSVGVDAIRKLVR